MCDVEFVSRSSLVDSDHFVETLREFCQNVDDISNHVSTFGPGDGRVPGSLNFYFIVGQVPTVRSMDRKLSDQFDQIRDLYSRR